VFGGYFLSSEILCLLSVPCYKAMPEDCFFFSHPIAHQMKIDSPAMQRKHGKHCTEKNLEQWESEPKPSPSALV